MQQKIEPQLDFEEVSKALKNGQNACRNDWIGKGTHIFLIGTKGRHYGAKNNFWGIFHGINLQYDVLPFVAIKTADGEILPWKPSQADLLANDWQILPNE